MSIAAHGRGSKKCRWCGRRRIPGAFRLVPTSVGPRELCFDCRNPYLPIFGGGKPYGKEGAADAGGEDKAKPVRSGAEHVPLPPPESELAHSAERSRASKHRARR